MEKVQMLPNTISKAGVIPWYLALVNISISLCKKPLFLLELEASEDSWEIFDYSKFLKRPITWK